MERHRARGSIIAIGIAACHKNVAPVPELDCDGGSAGWPQWALGSSHTGTTCAQGESVSAILFSDVVDEHAAAEEVESRQEFSSIINNR
jgi:hypothetical protein